MLEIMPEKTFPKLNVVRVDQNASTLVVQMPASIYWSSGNGQCPVLWTIQSDVS